MVLAWNLSFGVEIRFWRGIQVSPPGCGKEDVLGRWCVFVLSLCLRAQSVLRPSNPVLERFRLPILKYLHRIGDLCVEMTKITNLRMLDFGDPKKQFGKSAISLIRHLNINDVLQLVKKICLQFWNFQMVLVRAQSAPSCPACAQSQQSIFRRVPFSYLNYCTKSVMWRSKHPPKKT